MMIIKGFLVNSPSKHVLSLIHMVCFCTYGKKHIWKKHICFSAHMICREHICSDILWHLPGILYHHKF